MSPPLPGPHSRALYERAVRVMPGGVNSPVRAFRAVGGSPLFFVRGEGPYLWDEDGNRFVDLVLSWGPLVLGHAHPEVVEAVRSALERGTSFGAPTRLEVDLAEALVERVPSLEAVRLVNSGTEAVMSAVRLARAATGRDKVIKFAGCYHGHADGMLVRAGSGVATLSLPDSPGVPEGTARDTLVARYNDLASVSALFDAFPGQVACVVVEPVAGNMGVVLPRPGFLEGLRALCDRHGALLVFDEVLTGFRVHPGGAQALYGVRPDLTALGKVIGGGLPVGAYGGRRDLMEQMAPSGPVYQAGTLSGNPLAVSAGLATLRVLGRPGVWEGLSAQARRLQEGLRGLVAEAGLPASVAGVGSLFTLFFGLPEPPADWDTARQADAGLYARWFWGMLERGVYLPPSPFEACFLSTAHTGEVVDFVLEQARAVLLDLAKG